MGTFLAILPFALAAAVSPMMLTEQTLLLSSSGGKTASRNYAIAASLVLLVFVALLVLFGRSISLPQLPELNHRLDIAIGLVLVGTAYVLHRRSTHSGSRKRKVPNVGSRASFAFGAFSMATNFTSLALVVPAAKTIAASDAGFPERELLVVVLVAIVTTPAWLPLALTAAAPGPAARILNWIEALIETRGGQITRVAVLVLGLFLIGRGLINLL